MTREFLYETIKISDTDYKVGTFLNNCPYSLVDIIEEIKKKDKFNYSEKLYELDFKLLPLHDWEYNIPLLDILDDYYQSEKIDGLDDDINRACLKRKIRSIYRLLYIKQGTEEDIESWLEKEEKNYDEDNADIIDFDEE